MKRKKWELVCQGALAERMEVYEIDALHCAQQLSKWAPLLKVQLYEIGPIGAVLDSTWEKGIKVKP